MLIYKYIFLGKFSIIVGPIPNRDSGDAAEWILL